ncbi:MAG: diguanylate cyclase [Tenericutes bacterium]|jgi:GGDEF domain-containing protein|nr:diguanylate cyclase [Mycoplasmatota bacterium]
MIDVIYYVIIFLTWFLFASSIIIYKKLNIWKLIVLILVYTIVVIWEFFPNILQDFNVKYLEEIYLLILIFGLIIMAVTFRRKIQVTKNLTDYDFFELEKELDRVNKASDLLRKRFIYSIDLLNEGLVFYESDYSGLYITDQVKALINTDQNQLTMDEYLALIHEEDKKQYLQNIKKMNDKLSSFEIKYRIQAGENYAWVIEKGKMFKHNKAEHIISTFKPVNLKLFPDTMIEELDSLPYEDDLTKTLSILRKEKQTFYLIMLHLTNIPDINKRFGRDVGNLMIAEYVKNMRYHFAREKNTLFRITGIQFALIIKDELKYQNLHRALSSGGDLINLKLNIGGIQQIIYPNLGVMKSDPWSKVNINDLISLSNKALEEAISDNKNNYSIFGGA